MKDLKKYFNIKALPEDVYAAFTNETLLDMWTGEKAIMPLIPSEEFEWFGGDISGKNLEFDPGRKIIQEWYFGEEKQSIVNLKIHPNGKITTLELKQTNIPDEVFDNIAEGWQIDVIEPIRDLLEDDEDDIIL